MDLQAISDLVGAVSVPLFAVTSMAAVGLGQTVRQFIAPLRSGRLLVSGAVANFLIAPALALVLTTVLPIPADARMGLMVLACAAGAPFALKLTRLARGDMPSASALLAVMLVATTVFMPVVLPLLLPGAQVSPASIAAVLLPTMLLPLGAAIAVRQLSPGLAGRLQGPVQRLSFWSMLVMLANQFLADHRELAGLIGTGTVLAIVLFTLANLGAGWALGTIKPGVGPIVGISASQRNMGVATLVAVANFGDSSAVVTVVLAGFLALILLLPLTWLTGRAGRAGGARAAVAAG
ncbi:MAG: hypothetical protein MOP51_2316 [Citricoccus sp.]|nr:hypothetical protein [Citricoccus sp. WCRC_4]